MSRKEDMPADVTLAEGAVWLVRLQDPDRTPETDVAFREWMQDPRHARAFSQVTETWEVIPGAVRLGAALAEADAPLRKPKPGRRLGAPLLAAGMAVAVIVAGVVAFASRDTVFVTQVGQQQTVNLSDGSRLALNTDSRVVMSLSRGERRARLDRGEAMFEVAKDAARPFLVEAGDGTVRAVGTAFTVRKGPQALVVSLVEGKVEVTRHGPRGADKGIVAVLAPGERLTMRGKTSASIDRPNMEAVIAWRRGEAMFDDTPLGDAVAELNRYSATRVEIRDPSISALRISGVFQTNDAVEFTQAIAGLHGLRVERAGNSLALKR